MRFPRILLVMAALALWSTAAPATLRVEAGGGIVAIELQGEFAVSDKTIAAWVRASARTVSRYYGRLPMPRVTLRIRAVPGSDINGTAYGDYRTIEIRLGHNTGPAELERDWVLVHELLHLGHPDVAERHKWFKEGLATYVEPIVRARVGDLSAREVWAAFVRDLPQGQPRPGDDGLDYTPTWGRTYWGGALFFFLADIRIRQATGNEKGLQDALRAILAAGGNLDARWDIRKALAIGDAATGTSVLTDLYNKHRDAPVRVNLDALWRKLGVRVGPSGIELTADAPWAATRRAIVQDQAIPNTLQSAATPGSWMLGVAASNRMRR